MANNAVRPLEFPHMQPKQVEFSKATSPNVCYGGARGGGKAEPLTEPVLTPFGFRPMGDMKIGSTVCTTDGTAKVIGVYPQGEQDIYRVTFNDGASVRCTLDHLWQVRRTSRKSGWKVCTTAMLIDYLKTEGSNLLIPLADKIVLTPGKYGGAIKPYTLGVLLGDGSLSGTGPVTLTTDDEEIARHIEEEGYNLKRYLSKRNIRFGMPGYPEIRKYINANHLNCTAKYKYVPNGYKLAPENIRRAVLQGLMDTDGYADVRGHCEYCTISKRLAEDVQWLVRSLGGRASIREKKTFCYTKGYEHAGQLAYMVYIQTKDNANLFRLSRKKERCQGKEFNGGISEMCRKIVSIEPCGREKCQCIAIDDPRSLYITTDFIVTHNTFVTRWKAIGAASLYAGIKILIVRATYGQLNENFILPMQAILAGTGIAKYKDSDKSFVFTNGSRIKMSFCDTESDVLQFQGLEYDMIFIDEATQISENQFMWISATCRGVNDFPKRVYLTCNPGGKGHEWVKRLFIDRDYRDGENPDNYYFIQAKVTDNPAMMKYNPSYLKWLDNLPAGVREAWRDGSWDVFTGQFFSEFDRHIHVCEPFAIPQHWRRYVSLDYGYSDMCAVLWHSVNEQGNVFTYREIHESRLLPAEAAYKIRQMSQNEKIDEFIAPPDLFSKQRDGGRSTAEQFGEHGVYLSQGSNKRVDGWLAVKEQLKVYQTPDGGKKANLQIFSNCINLVRCLPKLQYDEEKLDGDVLKNPHDITHAPDALRYFCIAHTAPAKPLPGEQPFNAFRYCPVAPQPSPAGYGDKIRVV